MMSLENYMNFSVITIVVMIAYNIYVLILNKKQADVKKLIERTNELLEEIKQQLKK